MYHSLKGDAIKYIRGLMVLVDIKRALKCEVQKVNDTNLRKFDKYDNRCLTETAL